MVETWCLPYRDVFIIFYLSMGITPVILSAAKDLARRAQRSFAALRMTARTPLKSCHPEPMRCAQGKLRAGPLTGSLLSKCLVGEGDVPLTFPCCAAYCIIRLFWICLHRRWLLFLLSDGRYLC